ncbi:MAG TPA: serine/threonine-protein kinase [Solirubrobacterales bacterium]|nr:serine/threonine-protein kinase [Solirubrobacterales bacterium]
MGATIASGELLKERYRLERTLGRGGMAAVWLGQDERLERPVAVKVLSDTIAGDPGFVARFRREARTAASLSHPNLVGVYDYSDEGERPYLVMQFVPGENLAARLERGETVDCEKLARELLEALDHIHSVGILHRDIKPANVIVEPDGTAKLIDFGIALPRGATALTSPGLVLGTERYAAPEVMEGRPATERSDLYSAGVLLRSCEGQCSRALGALIGWMTSREPGARPASARQALVRLERAEALGDPTQVYEPTFARERREHEPIPAAVPLRETTPGYAKAGSNRSRWGAAVAILGTIAVLAVGAAVLLGSGEDQNGNGRARAAKAAKAKNGKSKPAKQTAGAGAGAEARESSEATAVAAPEATEGAQGAGPESEPPAAGGPEAGAALNEQGYALIQAGEYDAAVPVLEAAVASYPEGSEDVAYAYALYNLGNALRLSGRPDEAIPVLEQRLAIPNQTPTVERELEAARAEAGGAAPEAGGPGEEGD